MPAVSGGLLGAGRRPQRRRVPTRPSPSPTRVPVPRREVSVGSPRPAAPTAPQRVHTDLRHPFKPTAFAPVARFERSTTTPAQQQAARNVRRAVSAVPPSRALPRQPDIQFTPQQRKIVQQTTVRAVRKFAAQQGIHPQQAVKVLQTQGGPLARQQLHLFRRAVDEDRALAFRATTRQTTGSVRGDSNALTALQTRSQARPGKGPRGAAGTAVDVVASGGPGLYLAGKAGQKVSERFHQQLQYSGVPDSTFGNLLRDAVDIPAQAIPSTAYALQHPAAAAKGFVNTDPLALAAQGRIKEARRAAQQHPGVALLEVATGAKAVDNAAGFVARRGAAPRILETQHVPGTNIARDIHEPKGLVAAKLERRGRAKNTADVTKLQEDARAASRAGEFDKARHLRSLAAQKNRGRLPEDDIVRRVDEFQAQAEPRRRQDAAKIDHALPEFKHTGEEAVASLRVQGIARATKEDLNGLLGELDHQHDHGGLTRPQMAANRELRTRLHQYLNGDNVDLAAVESKAQRYAATVNDISERLVARGMLTSDSAKFVPYAVRNAGFRHSAERLRSPEYIAHLDAKIAAGKATSQERQIYRQYQTARRASARQEGVATQAVSRANRQLLQQHPDYVQAAKARNKAATELVRARKALGNAARNPELVKEPQAVAAYKRFRLARQVKEAADANLRDVSTRVQTEVEVALAQRQRGGRLPIEPEVAPLLAQYDRQPRPVLARLEKVRANEGLLERQHRNAQAHAEEARQRVSETRPPKGSRYRKPGFAPPEVVPRLERMNQLRDEARSFREQQRAAQEAGNPALAEQHRQAAIYREKVAAAIREEVERMPAPRVTGSEFIDAVTDHMVAAGYAPEDIAFVTQAPGLNSAGAYFVDWSQRRGISGPHRTGEATLKGAVPSHPEVLRENARRLQSLLSADENFSAFLREFGLRDPKRGGELARFKSAGEARDAARAMMFDAQGNEIPGAYEWSTIRINPWLGKQEQLRALLDDVNAEGIIEGQGREGANTVIEAIQNALDTSNVADDAPGEFALIPKVAQSRLLSHTKVLNPSDGLKVLRWLNSAFRRTVLATSVPWITGNIIEGLLRAGIERAGIGAASGVLQGLPVIGKHIPAVGSLQRMNFVLQALERMDPEARASVDRQAFGGGQAGLIEKGTIYTAADQFRDSNRFLQRMAYAAHRLHTTPGVKQAADFWRRYTDWVFHSVNHGIEARIQMAIGGRHLFPMGTGKINAAAIEDAARGLTNTKNQVALARAVERAYGKYDAFGPTGRQFIMLYTPFVAWSLNAVKFLADVMPRDHPALTAAIAASYNASKQWREDHGMSYFIEGALPGFLQGSYPTSKGPIRISRFTPFGIASDLPGNFGSLVLPQYHGALMALDGLDWKGQRLRNDDGTSVNDPLKLSLLAATQFAYASVPVASQIDRFIAGGGDPKALLDIINPVKPVKSDPSGGGGGTGGFPSPSYSGGGSSSGGGNFPSPSFK